MGADTEIHLRDRPKAQSVVGVDENPDLDLAPHRAAELVVSRLHAVLIPTPEGLFIADLESTNGTWVNGEYLNPDQRHRLMPGDRVELGLLVMAVKSVTRLHREEEE